jgi:hypothetical protein
MMEYGTFPAALHQLNIGVFYLPVGLASSNIPYLLIEQNIKKRTGPALCVLGDLNFCGDASFTLMFLDSTIGRTRVLSHLLQGWPNMSKEISNDTFHYRY